MKERNGGEGVVNSVNVRQRFFQSLESDQDWLRFLQEDKIYTNKISQSILRKSKFLPNFYGLSSNKKLSRVIKQ